MKYSMTCTCGDTMTIDAANREEAVVKMKEMWTPEMIQKHMSEKHPAGEPVPTLEQVHMMIDQKLEEVK